MYIVGGEKKGEGRFLRLDDLMDLLKELGKKIIWFHSNSYIEKLGFPSFSIFDPTCSIIYGFYFDFDFDFILYSFHSCRQPLGYI